MNKLPNLKDILLDTFTKLIEQFSTFTSNLISAIVILLVGWIVAKTASVIIKKVMFGINVGFL